MPLAFDTLSHGTIAFGFFNIDSDMLLLEQYFLFGSEFCQHLGDLAQNYHEDIVEAKWPIYVLENRARIGDLMGAIHGVRFVGFIGELYRRYPFPQKPEDFKQKPEGHRNQEPVRGIIAKYARPIQISVVADKKALEVDIGDYKFSRDSFQALIKYVWRGGYPGWQDDIRPDYVEAMKAKMGLQNSGLFEGINF